MKDLKFLLEETQEELDDKELETELADGFDTEAPEDTEIPEGDEGTSELANALLTQIASIREMNKDKEGFSDAGLFAIEEIVDGLDDDLISRIMNVLAVEYDLDTEADEEVETEEEPEEEVEEVAGQLGERIKSRKQAISKKKEIRRGRS